MIKSLNDFNIIIHDVPPQVGVMAYACTPPSAKYVSGKLKWENMSLLFFNDSENIVVDTLLKRLTPNKSDQSPLHITIETKDVSSKKVVSEMDIYGCIIENIEFGEINKETSFGGMGWERCHISVEFSYLSVERKNPK